MLRPSDKIKFLTLLITISFTVDTILLPLALKIALLILEIETIVLLRFSLNASMNDENKQIAVVYSRLTRNPERRGRA
ncbi:hypothetical protein [Saccharolobus islandicus]|uniref:hypothetical protein n=1 Tax=Saccharolobus islandicus TaxID=43080 RepID=UPI00035D9C8C|nr:hypothetical protein [Sulfolobus islandicus]